MKGPGKQAKRPVGRPSLGKLKVMLSINRRILSEIDQAAREHGLTRSAYIEMLVLDNLAGK
jgi:hypothetical protein